MLVELLELIMNFVGEFAKHLLQRARTRRQSAGETSSVQSKAKDRVKKHLFGVEREIVSWVYYDYEI